MNHILGILLHPHTEWDAIRQRGDSVLAHYLKYVLIIALLPPIAWYVGATEVGWNIGDRNIRLTDDSALQIVVLFYLCILCGVGILGYMVHWMSETYEASGEDKDMIAIRLLSAI
ncbi:MAG: Yip1 family protein, partial [Pseudomonadota bacterium]